MPPPRGNGSLTKDNKLTANSIMIITDIATVAFSAGVSVFISGSRWGTVQTELRNTSDRLAKIEGMFELKIKESK